MASPDNPGYRERVGRWLSRLYRRGYYDGADPLGCRNIEDEEIVELPDRITTSAPFTVWLDEHDPDGR